MDLAAFKTILRTDEGNELKPYQDTKGKITIGVGRNLSDRGISAVESDFLLTNDIQSVMADLNREYSWWAGMSDTRQLVFASMVFNMGIARFSGFGKMISAARAGNFSQAAAEIMDSTAARDLPARYSRLAQMMEKG